MVVPEHQVFDIPAGFTTADAAGFPGVFMTAYFALFELAHVRAGDLVLIHSAALSYPFEARDLRTAPSSRDPRWAS